MKSIYKILLITDNHSPQGGGAEKYFFTLKALLAEQPNITVHSMGFGPRDKVESDSTVLQETKNPLVRYFWRLFFNPRKYWQIKRAIRAIAPDVIHLHNVKKYTISLLKAVKPYAVVQTVHDYSVICPTGWNLHTNLAPCPSGLQPNCRWQHRRDINPLVYAGLYYSFIRLRKLLRQAVQCFIAPSPQLATYLTKNNFAPVVWLPPFRAAAASVNWQAPLPYRFLYVGQLGAHKGVAHLLDEFARACAIEPRLQLYLAGTGKQAAALTRQAQAYNLTQNIHFLGWQETANWYPQAQAVIFPSLGLEAFGLVLTEAMRYGRPIIGTNRGPTAWLVEHEKTGLLYHP